MARRTMRVYPALALLTGLCFLGVAPAQKSASYAPVSPPAAVHRALEASLKTVAGWVDEKDYLSASEATKGLATLARLYRHQGSDAAWRQKTQALEDAVSRLTEAARKKSAADCDKALKECGTLLDQLGKQPSGSADAAFKATGATKTWMLLMEDSYRDARRSNQAKEIELFALAVAEEANAVSSLRGDAAWQKANHEVRDLALQAARQAKDGGIEPAKKALKAMYQRCEACHDRSKR